MAAWGRAIVIGVSLGVVVVLACLGAIALIALRVYDPERDDDVRCPRCDPDRQVIDIKDGGWYCLACGYEWADPDLARHHAETRRDVH